ncbi:MAG TPA: Lon-like protease helical domain-containing protein, partial [Anaerolineae bacterium]
MIPRELSAAQLRRQCDTQTLPFTSTADTPDLDEIIGQERATRAIDFGIDMHSPGYNIYAMGPAGAGKTSTIMRFLQRKAASRPVPPDWAYAHNFANPDRPLALRLPPKGGAALRSQVDQLLLQVADSLAKTFGGDQYAERRNALEREIDRQRNDRLRDLGNLLHQYGFDLIRTDSGLAVVPAKDGQPLTREQFEALTDEARSQYETQQPAAEEALERTLRQVREITEAGQRQLGELDQQVVFQTIQPLFAPLLQQYADWPDVIAYLTGVSDHMSTH